MSTPIQPMTWAQTPDQLPQSANSANKSAQVSNTQFLEMMITEMKNQDPTQPVDSTQMLSQEAQFASLEQMQNLNTNLLTLMAQQNISQATNLIGKQVSGLDSNGISVSGQVTGLSFAGGISTLTLNLANGQTDTVTLPNVTQVGP
jgi:flagellar basal-body rod modification protein FlgD